MSLSEEHENACTILRRLVVDEEKAPKEYYDLLEKIESEGNVSPAMTALLNKIRADEVSHRSALLEIKGVVCGEHD